MNAIKIDEDEYVIMKRSEYADVRLQFLDEGRENERLMRKSCDAVVMDVLMFYASDHNYEPNISEAVGVGHDGLMQCDLSNVVADNGKKARGAIAVMNKEVVL